MTREQAEANWIWHPLKGDLRPKEWPKNRRIRPTDRNIMAQQIARAGTLIHTAAKTTCPRKACKTDEKTNAQGTVTQLAIATFIENVNCLWCRKDYFKRQRPDKGQPIAQEEGSNRAAELRAGEGHQ